MFLEFTDWPRRPVGGAVRSHGSGQSPLAAFPELDFHGEFSGNGRIVRRIQSFDQGGDGSPAQIDHGLADRGQAGLGGGGFLDSVEPGDDDLIGNAYTRI